MPGSIQPMGSAFHARLSWDSVSCGSTPRAPIAKVMAKSAPVPRREYTATGVATDQDIDRYVDHARADVGGE